MDPLRSFRDLNLESDVRDDVNPFDSIPNEVLEFIFSHVRPKTLVQNVLPVCRRFYAILSGEKRWYRSLKFHPLNIQLCEEEFNSPDFSIIRTFDAIEAEQTHRKNWNEKERYTTAPNSGFVSSQSVKLFKGSGRRYCLSAEQSSLKLWSLDKMQVGCSEDDSLLIECDTKIRGLPLKIAMHGNKQFVANCDDTIKVWDIGESSITAISTHRFSFEHAPYGCTGVMAVDDGILACAINNPEEEWKSYSLVDIRNGMKEILICCYPVPRRHKIVSLQLKGNNLYILYDQQLHTRDIRRLPLPLQKHKFDKTGIPGLGYVDMDVSDGLIHCCHAGGEVTVLRERDLSPCYTLQVEQEPPRQRFMQQFIKTRGSLLALTRKTLRAYSVGSQPVELGHYNRFGAKPMCMDALDGNVVVGDEHGSITTWTNKD